MVRRLITGLTLLSVAGMTLVGCGSDSDDESSVDSEALEWAESFCGHIQEGSEALNLPETGSTDPQQTRDDYVGFLDSLSEQLDVLAQGIESDGPPPVMNGQESYDAAMTQLNDAREAVASATASLEEAEVSEDPASLEAAITEAGESMTELQAYGGPEDTFRNNPDIEAALDEAENCQRA
ncbi:hypothetical protein [Streptomyces sp. NBC_01803]|uniref:hypothetical protein n=1 Tax=Streptomyces sp. NBC_01803 TaxID=2975946 RepID=UPI002DDC0C8A|nr:hypothetical protein [Streptomyces sp. NBC_01803]WSA43570.1 hypothetical protein OIE51_04755 [Streptomyces sp. NBC_01803]